MIASPLDPLLTPVRVARDLRAIADAVSSLPALLERVEAMGADLAAMRRELGPLPRSIETLGAEITTMREDLSAAREHMRPMHDDLDRVETAVRELNPRFENVSRQLDDLRTDLSSVPFIPKTETETEPV